MSRVHLITQRVSLTTLASCRTPEQLLVNQCDRFFHCVAQGGGTLEASAPGVGEGTTAGVTRFCSAATWSSSPKMPLVSLRGGRGSTFSTLSATLFTAVAVELQDAATACVTGGSWYDRMKFRQSSLGVCLPGSWVIAEVCVAPSGSDGVTPDFEQLLIVRWCLGIELRVLSQDFKRCCKLLFVGRSSLTLALRCYEGLPLIPV